MSCGHFTNWSKEFNNLCIIFCIKSAKVNLTLGHSHVSSIYSDESNFQTLKMSELKM